MGKGKIKIEGLEELQKKLTKIAENVGPSQVEPILHESADTITQRVQSNVNSINKVTGNLASSPVTKKMPSSGGEPAPSIAAIDRNIAPHAWLIEYKHGRGFFRNAVDTGSGQARQIMEDGLKRLVEQGAG